MFENDDVFKSGLHLNIDADTPIYSYCCVHNEDDDQSRMMIKRQLKIFFNTLLADSGCDDFTLYLTTKENFRDDLVDDYKYHRDPADKPVNLLWAKKWCAKEFNARWHNKMEADDLLGVDQTNTTVIWSRDKDLRQIPGMHLDYDTRQIKTITHTGVLKDMGKKIYFDGTIGFYLQLLTGDSTDYIVGCGKRVEKVYKSGAKKGQKYISRQGVGAKAAMKILVAAGDLDSAKEAVRKEYEKIHGDNWQKELETQANLLWMVRYQDGEIIQRWTYDDREEYFDLVKGVIVNDYAPGTQAS